MHQKLYANFHIGGQRDEGIYPDEATWRTFFESFKNAGIEGYVLGIDIQPIKDDQIAFESGEKSEDELTYFSFPDKSHVRQIIALGEEYELELKACKFHNLWMKQQYSTLTFATWFAKYRSLILDQLNDFKNRNIAQNCEYVSILNESENYGANDSPNDANVVAFIKTIRTKYNDKYKIGISGSVNEETIKRYGPYVDMFMPFAYPTISFKGRKTTYADSVTAWESSDILKNIQRLIQAYPDKPIIICETGCKNYYNSLKFPEDSRYYTGELITNGEPFSIFLYGLLEKSRKNQLPNVTEIWLYYTDGLYDDTQKLIKKYTNGWGD